MKNWLPAIPNETFSQAARRVLAERLAPLADRLQAAGLQADEDIEHVHQLRVLTRRSAAALRLFGNACPPDQYKWWAKWLKRLRRAAGSARDVDVLLERLSAAPEEHAVPTPILKALRKARRGVQLPLRKAARKCPPSRVQRRIGRLQAGVAWRRKGPEPDFAPTAERMVREGLRPLVASIDVQRWSIKRLHALRIAGKRLRYMLEITGNAVQIDRLEEAYSVLVELQRQIGQLNDHATAVKILEALDLPERRRVLRVRWQLIRSERDAIREVRSQFNGWWAGVGAERLRRCCQ